MATIVKNKKVKMQIGGAIKTLMDKVKSPKPKMVDSPLRKTSTPGTLKEKEPMKAKKGGKVVAKCGMKKGGTVKKSKSKK